MSEESLSLKDRIFSAALEEFADKGYKTASTNTIMQSAGVSKGLIFHYFGSKKELYLECIRYACDNFTKEFLRLVDFSETDFFERAKNCTAVKIDIYSRNPQVYSLMLDGYSLVRERIMPELNEYFEQLKNDLLQDCCRDVDLEKLRKFAPPEKIFNYVFMMLEAFSNRYLDRYKRSGLDMELIKECIEELNVVYEIIRGGIYD